jgi:hypothetical protein
MALLACPHCDVTHWTVQIRSVLIDLEPETFMEILSCFGCARKVDAKTYAEYGIKSCDFCGEFRKDVEERSVYVDTDQNKEEFLCCGPCETDRLMSV